MVQAAAALTVEMSARLEREIGAHTCEATIANEDMAEDLSWTVNNEQRERGLSLQRVRPKSMWKVKKSFSQLRRLPLTPQ